MVELSKKALQAAAATPGRTIANRAELTVSPS